MDVFKLADASTCLLLEVFLVAGAAAKFVFCMLPCLYCGMSHQEAILIGLIMNFKGITEVVYASAFMDAKVARKNSSSYVILLRAQFVLIFLDITQNNSDSHKHAHSPV